MKTLNWKLIIQLSSLGLILAIATVFGVDSNTESILWFIVFPVSSFILAKKISNKYFLHGFILGVINSFWNILTHILFLNIYLNTHPDEANLFRRSTTSPEILMMSNGLIIGIVTGIIFGLFTIVLHRVLKRAESNRKRREEQLKN